MAEQTDLFNSENADLAVAEAPPAASGSNLGGGQLPPMETLVGGGDALPLGLYAERAYLEYAVSVVKGRALPDVCDGQKPVQRRILYAMHEMGLGAAAKPVKSARVVGDVLGKYHPHGDKAAYDALVRMAQDFVMRYPLIDGQGNFGSRDGDGAAAMRYTEARLTPYANLLLAEINQGTVDFAPNYDGSFREPELLPARLPMLLLNGASGIAVGMATEIPSHNLKEVAAATVALIRKPNIGVDELLQHIQGPDFAGGAQIISAPEAIREAYETGRGSLKMRARWSVEDLARGQWQVVVSELPPGTSTQKVMEEIEEITNPKLRPGKKALTQEQQQLKQLVLSVLDAARDESGKDAPVRLVLEPRSSKVDREEFMTLLLAHTSLESSASINMVMIGGDGRPRQKSLKDVLGEWIEFRFGTVRRRCRHRLDQVLDRIHVLEGRIVVFLNLDKVIKLIREADEPKAELMAKFKLSERQAEDILEIRLRQLAKLERIRIEQELDNLRKEQQELEKLLSDERAMRTLVIKEIEGDAKTHGDARRTLIQPAERAQVATTVVDEPVTVLFSQKGWVKTRTGHGHDASMFTFKEGDALANAVECRTVDNAIFFGSAGRVYTVPVAQLPGGRGDGVPVASLIELPAGTRITAMACGKADQRLLLVTSGGLGFTCKLGDMLSRQRGGRQFVTLDKGQEMLPPVPWEDEPGLRLAALSEQGRLLVFPMDEMKELSGGGKGVIIMSLELKEALLAVGVLAPRGSVTVSGTGRAGKATTLTLGGRDLPDYLGHRARKGRALPLKGKVLGMAVAPPPATG